ncbi:hypothetical protein F5Y18DRAFT_29504 [Xylariaceae sp. FL1019]|nr:hypothetical protein F5Y18DRAFT_29504 [Xylariaceae sp. FL1019]
MRQLRQDIHGEHKLLKSRGSRFAAKDFMTLIAVECKLTGHHPTWTNTYNKVDIYWTTHDSKGLTLMDIEHAEFCDTQFHHMTIQRKTAERLKEVRKFNATGKMGLRTVGNQPTKTAIAEEAQFGTTVEEPTAGPTSIETLADETRSDELRFAKVFEESEVDKMSSEVALSEETQTDEAKAEESRPEESNEPKPEEPKPEKPKPRSIPSFLF